ncbi:glycosyltransferase family 2 protein [Vibrio cyclitrophicus]|nr:glycosyltransferase family 2 protein [Vibrio cyclitrophicus]UPR47542.1 glycosyltransferase family 2 protein [Vibrio cyclitrophicus]
MKKKQPLVSIVMPAFNAEMFILESIRSILDQSYNNWELIVVDDNSKDRTYNIVEAISNTDQRVQLIKNTTGKKGAYQARNCALDLAKGQYIAFLDSDDTWEATKLEHQISLMLKFGYFATHTAYTRIDENGKCIGKVKAKKVVKYIDQLRGNQIGNLTGLYDRNFLGIFLQKDVGHEDYEMWLNILTHTDSIGIDKPLANYRVSSGSLSSNKFKAAFWHYNILTLQSNLSLFKRVFYFVFYIKNAVVKRL